MLSEQDIQREFSSYRQEVLQTGTLRCNVIEPVQTEPNDNRKVTSLIVLMHGFGASRDDLVGLAGPLLVECFRHGKRPVLAFPGGPIALDFGGAAWWHLNMARLMEAASKQNFDEMSNEVPPGIDRARVAVTEAVQLLLGRYQLTSNELILGGFSQGAMLAVDTAIRGLERPPAGLAVWSGALICESIWSESARERLQNCKIVQSHGTYDSVLPISTGRALNRLLAQACPMVQFIEFAGDHQIPNECISAVAELIQ